MRQRVSSSVITWVDYSDDSGLDVEFKSGVVYRYPAIPRPIFESLLAAPSVGSFFNRSIRPCFTGHRIHLSDRTGARLAERFPSSDFSALRSLFPWTAP